MPKFENGARVVMADAQNYFEKRIKNGDTGTVEADGTETPFVVFDKIPRQRLAVEEHRLALQSEPATPDADGWITWAGGECPVPGDTVVETRWNDPNDRRVADRASYWKWDRDPARMGEHGAYIVAYRVVMPVSMSEPTTAAPAILQRAAQHLLDRAAAYDAPGGERSMARTVAVFNALHGTTLSEAQGWSFMAVLKQVRSFQSGGLHIDSIEDGAAYLALLGEAQGRMEGGV